MKNRIIEICELGKPQSIIHRENQPITELIKTDSLIKELNQQLRLHDVVDSKERTELPASTIPEFGTDEWIDCCEQLFGGIRKSR